MILELTAGTRGPAAFRDRVTKARDRDVIQLEVLLAMRDELPGTQTASRRVDTCQRSY